MKEGIELENYELFKEEKQIEINKIIALFKLNKEALLFEKYNNLELFNRIRDLDKYYGIIYFIKEIIKNK